MSEPAVPKGSFADIGDGLTIHYHEAGGSGRGSPVIFIHGSGPGASGWSNFKGNYPVFAERGLRVLVPDLLGYGYSSKPDLASYSLTMMADCIVRFARALGIERCSLVGNSLGGAAAIRIALDHPAMVERLVLMGPGGLEEREVYLGMPGIQAMMKAFFAKDGITREGLRETFRLQLFDPAGINDVLIEERFQIAITQPKQVLSTMRVPNQAGELEKLSCPVLAFWGVNDQFCPVSGAMTLARNTRRAKVVLLSECGHWVMVEYRALFNSEAITFLSDPERPERG